MNYSVKIWRKTKIYFDEYDAAYEAEASGSEHDYEGELEYETNSLPQLLKLLVRYELIYMVVRKKNTLHFDGFEQGDEWEADEFNYIAKVKCSSKAAADALEEALPFHN